MANGPSGCMKSMGAQAVGVSDPRGRWLCLLVLQPPSPLLAVGGLWPSDHPQPTAGGPAGKSQRPLSNTAFCPAPPPRLLPLCPVLRCSNPSAPCSSSQIPRSLTLQQRKGSDTLGDHGELDLKEPKREAKRTEQGPRCTFPGRWVRPSLHHCRATPLHTAVRSFPGPTAACDPSWDSERFPTCGPGLPALRPSQVHS